MTRMTIDEISRSTARIAELPVTGKMLPLPRGRNTSEAEYAAARNGKAFSVPRRKGGNKYGAVRVYHDRIWFDSKGECAYYQTLRLRERAGEIFSLVVHPVFPLHVAGEFVGNYKGDFRFIEHGAEVALDFKNPVTAKLASFRKNCRMVLAEYGVTVVVVMA